MTDESYLPTWRRVRRYAVPPHVIAVCTDRRLAGDWRGACAAANVDVTFDEAGLAGRFGAEVAARILDELAGFAPDLLRWHLPRALGGRTSLATDLAFVLAPRVERVTEDLPRLVVHLPKTVDGSQRLRLDVATDAGQRDELPGWCWDARDAHLLRAACGGAARLPFLAEDGTPRDAAALASVPGDDLPARAERAFALQEEGLLIEAWQAAGITLDPSGAKRRSGSGARVDQLPRTVNLAALPAAARALAYRYGVGSVQLAFGWRTTVRLEIGDDGIHARLTGDRESLPAVAEPVHRRPVDLDLLRHGLITPTELHPLVRQALRPDADGPAPQASPRLPSHPPVPVRCRGQWHRLHSVGGRLDVLDHTEAEVLREQMLHSLGGKTAGCFAAQQAWRSGAGRLPRGLREQRRDLMQRVLHGDTDSVLAMLDAGLDPLVRDGRGFTLLHLLRCLDHERLLPRLLAAGLPVDVRDLQGRTPLHIAVGWAGPSALVRALLDAGADVRAEDSSGTSAIVLLEYKGSEYFDEEDDMFDGQAELLRVRQYLQEAAA